MVPMSAPQRETKNKKLETATRLTRRQLGAALSMSAAALSQTPAPPIPQNPDDELKAARDTIRQNAQQLSKFDLPMSSEPAAHFKA